MLKPFAHQGVLVPFALVGLVALSCHHAGRAAAHAAPSGLGAGFRYSVYGPRFNPGPEYWARVGREMAARFPGATPEAIWIVGRVKGDGVQLSFPVATGDPLIVGSDVDGNEATLTLFDTLGFRVWLQVEPVNAAVEKLIHVILERYARHSCVVGVGVDVEWYRSHDPDDGQAVTDEEATTWLAAARAHNPRYRLFLKHWLVEKMPPTVRDGLLFVDDSQIFPSLDAMVANFAEWAKAFAPHPVAFQFGYPSDRPWWSRLDDPPARIGRRILETAANTEALFWVDFTVLEVFPPQGRPQAAQTPRPAEGT
jgi:hypothetical protein